MNYLDNPIDAICINDSGKPNEIKQSNWIVKDKIYTIIAAAKMVISNELAFKLKEVDTDCPEYPFYKASRFTIKEDDFFKLGSVRVEMELEEL